MNGQLYTAASGLLLEQRRVEMITNNLANASTVGFRPQRSFSTELRGAQWADEQSNGVTNRAAALAGSYEVPGAGPKRYSGRELDVYLGPKSLLAVETPSGRGYTRDGALNVSDAGRLVDGSGHALLDVSGKPIEGLSPATRITADGRVTDGETEIARLMLVRDSGGILEREGNNLFTANGGDEQLEVVSNPQLEPGWIEGSATNPLSELVRLIEAQRAFQGYQRLISLTVNDVNRKTVNEIAT